MTDVDGLNAGFARDLLEDYLENPDAVPAEWRELFESGRRDVVATHPGLARLLERTGNGDAPAPAVPAPAPVEAPPVTDELLATTRAVRKRLDLTRPVPRDVVLDCIRLATQAPAGRNVQRGRWLVIDDPVTRSALADLYRRVWSLGPAGIDIPISVYRDGKTIETRLKSGDRARFLKAPKLH